MVRQLVPKYLSNDTRKKEKTQILEELVNQVKKETINGVGFVRQDPHTKRWFALDRNRTKMAVSQVFRDEGFGKILYRSSRFAKQVKRHREKQLRCEEMKTAVEFGNYPATATTCSSGTMPTNSWNNNINSLMSLLCCPSYTASVQYHSAPTTTMVITFPESTNCATMLRGEEEGGCPPSAQLTGEGLNLRPVITSALPLHNDDDEEEEEEELAVSRSIFDAPLPSSTVDFKRGDLLFAPHQQQPPDRQLQHSLGSSFSATSFCFH